MAILHEIKGKSRLECKYPVQFNSNGSIIGDRPIIANMFNKYFTNVGPEVAKNVETPTGLSVLDYMGEQNKCSMFLTPANKNEVIRTVHSCGNKTSGDCNGITMSLVENVIECISEPVTHACNLSFKHSVFEIK